MEDSEAENGRFWCPTVETKSWGTLDAIALAVSHIRRIGPPDARIGVEFSFFPADAMDALRSGLVPAAELMSEAMALARRIAAQPPHSLRMCKKLLRDGQHVSLPASLEMAVGMQALVQHTRDQHGAVIALFEKRSARFTGN